MEIAFERHATSKIRKAEDLRIFNAKGEATSLKVSDAEFAKVNEFPGYYVLGGNINVSKLEDGTTYYHGSRKAVGTMNNSSWQGYDKYVKKLDGYTHFVALLFAVLMRYDSLRELIIGMEAEAYKMHHLVVNYQIRRSTISDANNRRSSDFFKDIYFYLYEKYKYLLSDSLKGKFWENLLYIMDSTTITLFSNILKGAGRNPKIGKKKGGIKAHTLIKASENVP